MEVLVIEDDEMYASLMQMALAREDIHTTIIGNAIDGIEMAASMQPDVIVMDVALPRMNGIEAVRRLRANPETAHIPIIVATASGTVQARHESAQVGADIFLEKPFTMRVLIDALRQLAP